MPAGNAGGSVDGELAVMAGGKGVAGPVQRILQALEAGQSLMEGRFRLGEELAGKKGFMTEMPTPSA